MHQERVIPTHKTCSRCQRYLPAESFHRETRRLDGLFSYCRQCSTEAATRWRTANPERARAAEKARREKTREERAAYNRQYQTTNGDRLNKTKKIKRLQDYGLTPEQLVALINSQGGLCAICRRPPGGRYRKLNIDHCHETGKVRGLLCGLCNTGLGFFRDDPATLNTAMEYLKSNGKAF